MNKRTFIKLFAGALASPPVMRLLAWAGRERPRNWAGNVEYSTDRVQTFSSLEQLQDYVKKENKLKVLGTRHCFNNIADSKDLLLSLKPMDNVIALDPDEAHRHCRRGHHVWTVVPLSRRQGICASQPRLVAPYIGRGRVQHGNPWFGPEKR